MIELLFIIIQSKFNQKCFLGELSFRKSQNGILSDLLLRSAFVAWEVRSHFVKQRYKCRTIYGLLFDLHLYQELDESSII